MQNQSEEIGFFDAFTQKKEYSVFTDYGYNSIIRVIKQYAQNHLSEGHRAADFGCGTGSFTERLFHQSPAETYGIDISPNSIKTAQQRNTKVNYLVGDITNLDFEDNFFDLILYSAVLHHFTDTKSCLKEGYRLLKKGGVFLSFDPNIRNPFMWLYRHPSSPLYSNVGKTENEQLFSAKDVNLKLQNAGFTNIRVTAISGVLFRYIESALGRTLLPIYNAAEFLLGLTPFAKKIGSFLIGYAQK